MTTTAGNPPRETDAWDRYWAYGNLHSFSQVTSGNYAGRIAAFWQEVFEDLADNSRILDIATGNGAIPLLALEAATATKRTFDIHATDLAAIDPNQQVSDPATRERLQAIHFHARTPAESLPFERGSFDLVCSQFGLEYSDPGESVPETARVLRPGGGLALVMHHDRSAVVLAARDEAAQADFVLDEVKLYLKTRNLLRAQAETGARHRDGGPHPKVAKKRKAVDQAIHEVQETARQRPDNRLLLGPLNYVQEVLTMAERSGPARALEWLDEAQRRVRATRERLAAMQAAARDADTMADFARDLTAAGFDTPTCNTLSEDNGEVVGWQVRARRQAD